MMSFALQSLEAAINSYLRLDPDTIARLAKLSGKAILFEISDWNTKFYVLPNQNGIELNKRHDNEADAIISGTLNSLFNLGIAKGANPALFKNKIEISGDMELGEEVRDIFSNIDIDWEEHLSRFVGDIAAHKISSSFKRILDIGKNTASTLGQNVKEFLQSESKQVPTAREVEQFVEDVSILRNDVDRAEARLNRLLAKRNNME